MKLSWPILGVVTLGLFLIWIALPMPAEAG
jgi:hypothetical protein